MYLTNSILLSRLKGILCSKMVKVMVIFSWKKVITFADKNWDIICFQLNMVSMTIEEKNMNLEIFFIFIILIVIL